MRIRDEMAQVKVDKIEHYLIEHYIGVARGVDRLPSEAELCRRFGVSRGTVSRAVERLASKGLLYRVQGKGTFVKNVDRVAASVEISPERVDSWAVPNGEIVTVVREWRMDSEVPSRLWGGIMDRCLYIETVRYRDGEELSFNRRWVVSPFFKHIDRDRIRRESLLALLKKGGVSLLKGEFRLSVGTGKEVVCESLGVDFGEAMLVRKLAFWDGGGRIVIAGESWYRSDRVEYRVDVVVQ